MPKLSEVMGQQQAPPAQAAAAAAAPARLRLSQVMPEAVAPRADFSDVTASVSSSDQIGAPAPKRRTAAQAAARSVLGLGTRNVVEGAADLLGIFYDPIADAVNWVGEKGPTTSSLITGQPERYFPRQHRAREMSDMLLDGLGVPKPENAEERVAGDIGRGITGTALTMGAGGMIQGARGTAAAASNPSALSRLGDLLTAQPVQQVIASTTGAGAAGVARENGVGPGGQAAAGLAGALTPAGLGALGSATLRGLVRGPSGAGMQQAIDDFAAIGATPSAGQASGNRLVQGAENLLAGAPTSTGVMTKAAEGQADDIGSGLGRMAEGLSRNASAERAGRAIEQGTDTFVANTKATKRALYWDADRHIPSQTQLPVARTERVLTEMSTPTPGAEALTGSMVKPRIRQMAENLQKDLAAAQANGGAGIPYEAVRKIRSDIGAELSEVSLSVDRPTAELKRLYAALSGDMEDAAKAIGPAAEQAAKRANNYTKAVASRIEQVERVIDRNGGPERVFNAVMEGSRDGGTTLRAVMQSLPESGQKSITAAVIKRMGMATPGAQDAAGEVFSAGTFMTNWNRLSSEARRALFDRYGKGFSEDMDRLARVADIIKQGSKVYANPSGTANRAAALTYGGALVASLFDPSFVSTGGLAAGGVAANAAARWLTNPKIVAALAETTKMPVGAAVSGTVASLRENARRTGDEDMAEVADALERAQNENARTDQGANR